MARPIKRINFIGCGHVGQTLAYLWHEQGIISIGDVLNTSLASAVVAVGFIHAGNPLRHMDAMQPADIYLIGCSDNHIQACCNELSKTGLLRSGDIVFHCSGALSSNVLNCARSHGALVASVHPVKSFADPAAAITHFANTYCGVEGDPPALRIIEELVAGIGGVTFALNAEHKTIYHAASVIACNYLVALEECSLLAFAHAGVERELAMKILQPMVENTIDNVFSMGTTRALTGPIARGDHEVVGHQLTALTEWEPDMAELYRLLGQRALALSVRQGSARQDDLARLQRILDSQAI